MNAVSLFAGIGGFDLALERSGIKVVASVEIDKKASEVLKKRFPNSTIFGDIKEVTGEQLINAGFKPKEGIITGGFPCQDLSVAGKRVGITGARSGLFWEIIRLLKETKAQNFILENVPGLLSSGEGRDMGVVIRALDELGYSFAWRVLDAQYFGVPQRRRRVFIVGSLGNDWRSPCEILAIAEGRRGYSQKSNSPRKGSTSTFARGTTNGDERSIAGTLAARDYKGLAADDLVDNKAIIFEATRVDDVRIYDNYSPTVATYWGTGGARVPYVFPIQDGRDFEKKQNGLGVADQSSPSYTLDTTGGQSIATESFVRRLTPTECERLQGFPDNWTADQADSNRYKQLGNAVAVPVVEWIIKRMVTNNE